MFVFLSGFCCVVVTGLHLSGQEKYDGRVRSFPHVQGNWASYVFIPFHLTNQAVVILDKFAAFLNKYFR
jgi:hypothetical protein